MVAICAAILDGPRYSRGVSTPHQASAVELQVLVATRPVPVADVVSPFVREAYSDTVFFEAPQLLDQPVVELASALAREELDDLLAAGRKFGAVSPTTVAGAR
jgi:hypothetical protein